MLLDTPSLREQLLAAVSTSPAPRTTAELVAQAPPRAEHRSGCYPTWHGPRACYGSVLANECLGTHHVVLRRRYHHEVYAQLRALEQQGKVERVRVPDMRSVAWRTTEPTVPLEDLEALWNLPAQDPR